VTCLAVDPSHQYLLSGSEDSTILVWSLTHLVAIDKTEPVLNFTHHRASVTSIGVGHSASSSNFALSVSEDKIVHMWLYCHGSPIKSFLLEHVPQSLAIDPADRVFYIGYPQGSVQVFDLHKDEKRIWNSPTSDYGAISTLALNYDATRLISGHSTGKVCTWDINQGRFDQELYNLPGPITNLISLVPEGLPRKSTKIKLHTIVKPKSESKPSMLANFQSELLPLSSQNAAQAVDSAAIWAAIADQKSLTESRQLDRGTAENENFISLDQPLSQDRAQQLLQEQTLSLQNSLRESHKKLRELRKERDALLGELKAGRAK
jgi:pre-rRNA-processing protein IPI3